MTRMMSRLALTALVVAVLAPPGLHAEPQGERPRPAPPRAVAPPPAVPSTRVPLPAAPPPRKKGQELTGREVREALVDRTATGNMQGMAFQEYYAPNGKVFGENGGIAVEQGCWTIQGSEMCYKYNEISKTEAFCFTFEPRSDNVLLIWDGERLVGWTKTQPGDPKQLQRETEHQCEVPAS